MSRLDKITELMIEDIDKRTGCGKIIAEEVLCDILDDAELWDNIIKWSEDIALEY